MALFMAGRLDPGAICGSTAMPSAELWWRVFKGCIMTAREAIVLLAERKVGG